MELRTRIFINLTPLMTFLLSLNNIDPNDLESQNNELSLRAATVKESIVYASLGQDAEIFASTLTSIVGVALDDCSNPNSQNSENIDIRTCQWSRVNLNLKGAIETSLMSVNASENKISWTGFGFGKKSHFQFQYFGRGVSKGECGLRIYNLTKEHFGLWGLLFMDKQSGEIWTANVTLLQYEKPLSKISAFSAQGMEFKGRINVSDCGNGSEQVDINCCSNSKGEQTPIVEGTKLELYYDGKQIFGLQSSRGISPCIKWQTRFTYLDNQKSVKCRVRHPDPKTPSNGFRNPDPDAAESQMIVNVDYPPRLFPKLENGEVEILQSFNFQTKTINLIIKVRGNPIPKLSIIDIDTTEKLESKSAHLMIKDPSVLSIAQNDLIFNVTIDSPKSNKTIKVCMENYLGKDTGWVEIVIPSSGNDSEGSSYLRFLIIGIVSSVSVTILLVSILLMHYIAKKRGWLCYKGRIGKYILKR